MQKWRRLSAEAFAAPSIETNIAQEENQGYESEVARVIFDQFPHLKARASNLLAVADRVRAEGRVSMRPGSHQILGGPIGGFGGVEPAPIPPPDGWFWWAQTQPTRNDARLSSTFLSDGLHIFGDIRYDEDSTYYCFTGAIATFELHAARRPPSNSGRWQSAPFVELFGEIAGFTANQFWPMSMDDKWCKCFLNLRQTAFQLTSSGPIVLANLETRTTLIDEENDCRWASRVLGGFTPMPVILSASPIQLSAFSSISM